MKKRVIILTVMFSILFSGLLGRVYYLIKAPSAQAAASQNSWKVTVATTRGTIYDCRHTPLVNEETEYRAAFVPNEQTLAVIQEAISPADITAPRNRLQTSTPVSVRLQKPVGIMPGLELFLIPRRVGSRLLAPHLIGYLDHDGRHGVAGIESACDTLLNQYSGEASAAFAVNGGGRYLPGAATEREDTTERSVGGVVLTVDREIQTVIENIGAEYIPKGAVVVLEPSSGAIRGMASFPTFQPDTVAQSIESDNGALLNRALAVYDCGSVFKIVTMAAALEHGISPERSYSCTGDISVGGTVFHCHNRLGHGFMNLTDAFAQSCNVSFIRLAQDVGADALYSMANNFGFDQAITLIGDLRAAKAVIPTLSALRSAPAAVANLSFGQGYLMASPLHIARMVATVVNDGVQPPVHLITGYVDESNNYTEEQSGRGQRILSSATAETLQHMMEAVVSTGTGKSALPDRCTAAGKTGTAETGQRNAGKPVVQSWFAGYFPADNPQYVVTVLAEDAQNTGGKAAQCFREISNKLCELSE